jgi:hypothetical protein
LLNKTAFERLTEQVVGRWIDLEAKEEGISKWKDSILANVERGNAPTESTRVGVLVRSSGHTGSFSTNQIPMLYQAGHPDVVKLITNQLKGLRTVGVVLTLLTVRAIMVAFIEAQVPHIFKHLAKNGTRFKCSDSFVRKFLHNVLRWSERRATKAAQKLPPNLDEVLINAFLREACVIRDYGVPAALRVNTDQTQLVYQQGTKTTWNETGAKQVATVGQEEKRAFTLVPSISASGVLLPMQAVYGGKTVKSCPSRNAALYDEAVALKFRMLPSKSGNYWSTQKTMEDLVDNIIAPYFKATKVQLDLDDNQLSIWKIDCWSVHKSDQFLSWMRTNHPNIYVSFVPGGCTGVWQPLDVGIQRVMKLSMRRSAHRDIVKEVQDQLAKGISNIAVDTTVGTLRDRSVGWIVNAIHDLDCPDLILKVRSLFKMFYWCLCL